MARVPGGRVAMYQAVGKPMRRQRSVASAACQIDRIQIHGEEIGAFANLQRTNIGTTEYRSTATWNVTGAKDTTLDGMLDEARSTADAAARAEKYRAIQQYLFDNTGIFVPYHKTLVRAMSANVKGIEPVVIDAVRWEKIEVG